jgi:hypothetical protein
LSVLFLVEDERSASARTRGFDLVPGLASAGIEAVVEPLARSRLARRRQLDGASAFAVVVLARKLLAESDLARLRRAAKALVFDFDDAVGERPWDARARGRSFSRPRRFLETLRAADLVVAGSAWLRDLAAREHDRVRLLPVAVAIPPRVALERSTGDGRSGEVVNLLWTGSRATLGYLEAIERPLTALAARRPQVELTVVADARPRDLGIRVVFVPFTLASEEAALARADLGLMPLGADPWSRGKCGLKLARYLAWGVPAVSSRFGAGAEIVDAPSTGLLADDEGEWLASLETLVASPERRRALAARARADAAAHLSLEARVRSWAAVLREAAEIGILRLDSTPPLC